MTGRQNGNTDQATLAIERLIEVLQQQRQAMLRPESTAVNVPGRT